MPRIKKRKGSDHESHCPKATCFIYDYQYFIFNPFLYFPMQNVLVLLHLSVPQMIIASLFFVEQQISNKSV